METCRSRWSIFGDRYPCFLVNFGLSKPPEIASFDLVLHRLLDNKRRLQSALGLVPPEAVSAPELINEVFGRSGPGTKSEEFIDIQTALGLSWRLFEALIACIYMKEARSVILTMAGSDHGCDVVVTGWGSRQENMLIQCKSTVRDDLDSEVAVREVEGSRPFYEQALGVTFDRRCLHSTAKRFSRRTRRAAELCGVTLYGRSWLAEILTKNPLTRSAVLAADAKRKKI